MRNEPVNGDFSNTDSNSIGKINLHGMILFPKTLVYPILKYLQEWTHYVRDALMDLIRPHLKGPHLQRTIQKDYPSLSDMCPKQN